MTNTGVHEALILWLASLLGIVVIKDRQQAARPPLPYGMVDLAAWRFVDDNVTDMLYRDVDPATVRVTPDYEIEWTFLFFVYGPEGDALMRRLQTAFHLVETQTDLRQVGLVLHQVSGINSIPELVGESWEPRTQVNIVVRGKASDDFELDVIEMHTINVTAERS